MISKKRDRDCSDSKVNTSLWCLFWHGCRAMYDKAITCDKTGAKPSEVYGGILAGVVSLEKTLQAICLIFSSLNTTATFVAPDKGKHPPGRRRGKTTLVVTFLSTFGTRRGKSRRMSSLVRSAFKCIMGGSESSVWRGWLNTMSSSRLARSPEETFLST